jgi:hypothetical protein
MPPIAAPPPHPVFQLRYAEMGSSAAILSAGYNIDSLMLRYQGVDWRNRSNWGCNAGCGAAPLAAPPPPASPSTPASPRCLARLCPRLGQPTLQPHLSLLTLRPSTHAHTTPPPPTPTSSPRH